MLLALHISSLSQLLSSATVAQQQPGSTCTVCVYTVGAVFLAHIPLGVLWASWICALLSDINLGSSQSSWFQMFLLFLSVFSFCSSRYTHYTLCWCLVSYSSWPLCSGCCCCCCCCCCSVFFLFGFQLWSFLLSYPKAQRFFAQPCPVSHQRHSSFLLVFLISDISFWFFLGISISLLTVPICSHMLSTLPCVC